MNKKTVVLAKISTARKEKSIISKEMLKYEHNKLNNKSKITFNFNTKIKNISKKISIGSTYLEYRIRKPTN